MVKGHQAHSETKSHKEAKSSIGHMYFLWSSKSEERFREVPEGVTPRDDSRKLSLALFRKKGGSVKRKVQDA